MTTKRNNSSSKSTANGSSRTGSTPTKRSSSAPDRRNGSVPTNRNGSAPGKRSSSFSSSKHGSPNTSKTNTSTSNSRALAHYYLVYKPFGMLSQFTPEGGHTTLSALGAFPTDVYPVGRLDSDSEGLLLLTNDKSINHQLLLPEFKHVRTYWAQVDGQITPEACQQMAQGLSLTIKGQAFKTLPCKAKVVVPPLNFPERNPPIRVRKNIPTSWVELELVEGKNHQVRKMTAAVGFPTLRLVRMSIESLQLGTMQPSQVRKLSKEDIYKGLKLKA